MLNIFNAITTVLIAIIFLSDLHLYAQAPQAFMYQAIIRDSNGEIVSNQNISLRIGIEDV